MTRVLVVGIDGGTLDLIRPWAAQGDLPNLARLMSQGCSGLLESTLPPVTSPAWPTFATGVNPGKHGVFDFIRPMGGEFELVNATSIRAPTLWELLSSAGRRVGVVNVPVTYPPTPVDGFLVAGMLSPTGGSFTHPHRFLDAYQDDLGPYRIAPRVQYKPGNEIAFLNDLEDLVECRSTYALRLMSDHPHDFLMFHFQATDLLQHALWKYLDPAHPEYDARSAAQYGPQCKRVFQSVDDAVGRMMERLPSDATIILMSDHGFGPLHYVVNMNLFLLDQGLLALKRGAWTGLKARLFRAGLSPAAIWHIVERVGLQNYVWQVSKSARNKVVGRFLSFDDVDWSRTLAYSIGHVGQIYINLQGREPEGIVNPGQDYEATRRRVVESLAELRHPGTGQSLLDAVYLGDQVTHGPFAGRGADIHVVLDGYRAIVFPLFAADNRIVTRQIRGDSGCHRRHGFLIASGPELRQGATLEDARIVDLAPTILHIMGEPVPDHMDGRVLTEAFLTNRQVMHKSVDSAAKGTQDKLNAEDAQEVEQRLRSLGYLG